MRIGFHWRITPESLERMEDDFKLLRSMGLECCTCGNRINDFYHSPHADQFLEVLRKTGIKLEVLSCNLGKPTVYNLEEGPRTVGFVPPEHRERRYKILADCAEFAKKCNVTKVVAHFGFTPECADDPAYEDVVKAARKVADICAEHDVTFLFETGEETPTTLLRLLEDAGKPNLAVNLDMANLIQYGRGEPCGAVDVLGKLIQCADAKDGMYPKGGRQLGKEVALGQGRVRFHEVISKLLDIGYDGPVMIEREAHTLDQRIKGIDDGKKIIGGIITLENNRRMELDAGHVD